MQLPFFYEEQISENVELLTVSEETSKHCVQVLRMKAGEQLLLTNGVGLTTEASIVSPDKKKMVVQTGRGLLHQPPATQNILGISFVKNPARIEWLLEKITEIGVTEIIPLICTRTEKTLFKAERFNNILVSAMLQSRQVYKPILHNPLLFEEAINKYAGASKFIAHCMGEVKPISAYLPLQQKRLVLIGPEGDFTAKEKDIALEKGFLALDLGKNRLRTETAGLVAITLLEHH